MRSRQQPGHSKLANELWVTERPRCSEIGVSVSRCLLPRRGESRTEDFVGHEFCDCRNVTGDRKGGVSTKRSFAQGGQRIHALTFGGRPPFLRSEEHTSELQSLRHLVC